MLENSFQRIGRAVEKNSDKVIIIWVIVILIMLPFSTLLFTNTSYNLSSDIVPKSSMASNAANYMSTYFNGSSNSSATNGNSSSSLVVVNTNESIYSQPAILSLINAQSKTRSYIESLGGNVSFLSFIEVENSSLHALANATKGLDKFTYPLALELSGLVSILNATGNLFVSSVYGLPLEYIKGGGDSASYSRTLSEAYLIQNRSVPVPASLASEIGNTSFPAVEFFKIFENNYTNTGNPEESILNTLSNSTFQYSMANHTLYSNLVGALSTPPLTYSNYTNQPGLFNSSYLHALKGVSQIVLESSLNSTIKQDITSYLVTSPYSFISEITNQTLSSEMNPVMQSVEFEVSSAIEKDYNGNPVQVIQKSNLPLFVKLVNESSSLNSTLYSVLSERNFSQYPVVPSQYLLHQLVGFDNSTQITEITSTVNLSVPEVNHILGIFKNSTSNVKDVQSFAAGSSALGNQLSGETTSGLIRALAIGIAISVLIVGIFFRSVYAAFLPLLIFLVSALTSMSVDGLLYKYVLRTSVSFITPTLLLILLLGLSSDYVVYIMARYRREYRNGNSSPASESTKWAGHAVFTSGITVGISYLALWIANIPLFSDAGISNAIGVLITILVANTLLIAILTRGKKRIFGRYRGEKEGKYFQKVASTVHENRLKVLGIFIVLTLIGSYVYFSTPTNMDLFSLVPPSSGIQAIEVVNSSFHGDFFDRGYIILDFQQPLIANGTYNVAEMNQITSLENRLINHTGITQVYGPTFPYGSQVSPDLTGVNATYRSTYTKQMDTFIGNNSHYAVVDFQLGAVAWSSQSTKNVRNLDSIITSTSGGDYKFYVGGLTEGLNNAYSFTSGSFAKLVPILSIAIFLVLFIQLGSVFTPIRLIFMVLASVIISLSIAYAFLFYLLHLSILIFLPMFTVITLLAVGLDYDIFMITRVREEVIKGNDDAVGIAKSITENGGVIVTLGSLLFATFGALVFSQLAIIQEIGAGLALGVLIDTFVSWPFFVPAVMLLLKRLNWWPSKFSRKDSGNSGS